MFSHIQEGSTILAPGSLHLAVYKELYKSRGNTLNIHVLSPEAYLSSKLTRPRSSILPVLYEYKNRLQDLPETNVFAASASDYDFLKSCYEFMEWVQMFGISSFPAETEKEKDLKEVIGRLLPVELWQKEAGELVFDPDEMKDVYILDMGYPEQIAMFLERMKKAGAHLIGKTNPNLKPSSFYWAASNTRKEIELVAQTIVSRDLDAEDIFIALSSPSDERVLRQVFNAREIPYTMLHPRTPSRVLKIFEAALDYILEKNPDTLQNLLLQLAPRTSQKLRDYLALFPDGSDLASLEYAENPLIRESEFESLKSLEAQAAPWKENLEKWAAWDQNSIPDIAAQIQDLYSNPAKEDVAAMDGVIKAYASILDSLHEKKDLDLFRKHLKSMHPSSALESMSGVLVGSPDEISALRKVVFYIGADSAHFPRLSMHNGIFDEEYFSKLEFPALDDRLEAQKATMERQLSYPKELYVLTPQATYDGKPVRESHEMNMLMGRFPKFLNYEDISVSKIPDFSLSRETGINLFAPEQKYATRASNLKTYEDCPLKHMLRCGLNLKTSYSNTWLQLRPEMLKDLMNASLSVYHKAFGKLSRDELDILVHQQFEFARKVFTSQQHSIDILELQSSERLWEMVQLFSSLSDRLQLDFIADNYEVDIAGQFEDVQVEIKGPLASGNTAVFGLFNPEDLSGSEIPLQATLACSLKPSPKESPAFRLSYGRGSKPASAIPVDKDDAEGGFIKDFLKNSIMAQDLQATPTENAVYVKENLPSYESRQEDLKHSAESFLFSMKNGCADPTHKKGACKYCSYRSVCRNAASERE